VAEKDGANLMVNLKAKFRKMVIQDRNIEISSEY
jgi:hypothetical protein